MIKNILNRCWNIDLSRDLQNKITIVVFILFYGNTFSTDSVVGPIIAGPGVVLPALWYAANK